MKVLNEKTKRTLILGILFFTIICPCYGKDFFNYDLETYSVSPQEQTATLVINIYTNKKKELDASASFAALKIIMFDGLPETIYSKPLIREPYEDFYFKYKNYLDNLYSTYSQNFITQLEQLTEYKKGPNKSTTMKITVKVHELKRDLVNKHILKTLSI